MSAHASGAYTFVLASSATPSESQPVIKKPSILFTGFEPFGGDSYNPSWAVAEAAAAQYGSRAVLLPVTYAGVREFALTRPANIAVVSFGLRANSPAVAIESVGSRIAGKAPDNDGVVVNGVLTQSGPPQLEVGPLALALSAALRAGCEYEIEDSNDAGGYVCNALLYHLLLARGTGGPLGAFIHVPNLEEAAATALGTAIGSAIAEVMERS